MIINNKKILIKQCKMFNKMKNLIKIKLYKKKKKMNKKINSKTFNRKKIN